MRRFSMSGGRGVVGVVLGLCLAVSLAGAQMTPNYVEPVGDHGASIDWTKGILLVKGQGAPPANASNRPQARMMATRAAKVDAQRNYLEAVNGVRVDAATLVENFTTTSDVIKVQVGGFVKGMFLVKTEESPDGGVEVTMGIKLTGDLANVILPKQTGGGEPIPVPPSVILPPSSGAFTGLIVDARGTGLRPAMAPKIRNEEGREVYGSAFVDRQYAVEQGMVGYLKDVGAAKSNARVTDRPLLVKAIKTDGPNKTDLVISNSDAQVLHGMKEHLNFLEKARVMVILD